MLILFDDNDEYHPLTATAIKNTDASDLIAAAFTE
jgi:hypothetical protein